MSACRRHRWPRCPRGRAVAVVHLEAVVAEVDVDAEHVGDEVHVAALDPARRSVGPDREEHLQPVTALLVDEEHRLHRVAAVVVDVPRVLELRSRRLPRRWVRRRPSPPGPGPARRRSATRRQGGRRGGGRAADGGGGGDTAIPCGPRASGRCRRRTRLSNSTSRARTAASAGRKRGGPGAFADGSYWAPARRPGRVPWRQPLWARRAPSCSNWRRRRPERAARRPWPT